MDLRIKWIPVFAGMTKATGIIKTLHFNWFFVFAGFTLGIPLFLFGIYHFLSWLPEPIGNRSDLFFEGIQQTIYLSLVSGILGFFIGILMGVGKISRNWAMRGISSFLIWFLRGTPLLVQILFVYYALPSLIPSLKFGDFVCAVIALAFNVGAYNAEAVRAALLAIPKGQSDAAMGLGLTSFQNLRWVVFPQAFKIMLPSLSNNFIALIKDSSLASSIGLLELSLAGSRASSVSFMPVPVLVTVASLYLFFTSFVSILLYLIEKRQNY